MANSPPVTPSAQPVRLTAREERAVLEELMLCAAPYVRSFCHKGLQGRNRTQARLLAAINRARGIVKQPVPEAVTYDGTPTDPEQLFRAYILAGGNWRALVAAVNRFAGEASCLGYQVAKARKTERRNQEQKQKETAP